MMKFRTLFILPLVLLAACSEYDSDTIEDQKEDIVSFLTGSHSPILMSEADAKESLDAEPEFYTTTGYTTYRYIEDYYSSQRESRTLVGEKSTLELTFWCYDFSSYTTPSDSYLFFTNDPTYESALASAGLNTQYWSFEPLKITLGKGDILNSIETALVGCREADKVELYLTYNMAYGNNWMGVSTLEAPIAFFCTIDSVEN